MNTINQDAVEFGLHVKQGGWRLGLLVARSVEKKIGGRPLKTSSTEEVFKISAEAFAKEAGTTGDRVLRHLDAWSRAANAGFVPAATDLNPGAEPELDVDALPPWSNFYDGSESRRRPSVSGDVTGTTTPELIAELIATNPEVAKAVESHTAARESLASARDERVVETMRTHRMPSDRTAELTNKHSGVLGGLVGMSSADKQLVAAKEALISALDLIQDIALDEDYRNILATGLDEVENVAHAIRSILTLTFNPEDLLKETN